MSNNAPDYENDLVFPPSMPRCDIEELKKKVSKLEEKLEIAVKALITYKNLRYDGTVTGYEYIAQEALAKIKEIK